MTSFSTLWRAVLAIVAALSMAFVAHANNTNSNISQTVAISSY